MKTITVVVLSVVGAIGLVFLVAHFTSRPPSEVKLIADFNEHRPDYERLRDMLAQDRGLLRVADWGIETDAGFEKPGQGRLSMARYNEYLGLLNDVRARGASRARGEPANPCVLVWASGFAADTRHRSICWLTFPPENQVAALKDFEKTPKPRKPVFRHIDSSWYISADW